MAHRIRLRKPWTRHDRIDPASDLSEGTRVDVPDSATEERTPAESTNRPVTSVVYVRRFNRPSGLQSGTQVQLEIGAVTGTLAQVRVNADVVLPLSELLPSESLRYKITSQMSASNELQIEIAKPGDSDDPPRLIGDVNLWIVD